MASSSFQSSTFKPTYEKCKNLTKLKVLYSFVFCVVLYSLQQCTPLLLLSVECLWRRWVPFLFADSKPHSRNTTNLWNLIRAYRRRENTQMSKDVITSEWWFNQSTLKMNVLSLLWLLNLLGMGNGGGRWRGGGGVGDEDSSRLKLNFDWILSSSADSIFPIAEVKSVQNLSYLWSWCFGLIHWLVYELLVKAV